MTDRRERERALKADQSFIVEAPAGSGKTGLLTQRYLALLAVVERPESIVAMTFTRKAAAEMRERIIAALEAAERGALFSGGDYEQRTRELALGALARDRQLGWNLLMDTARLQVQTIDSFCGMLTRQMPLTSEFGGVGEVVENAGELYALAARLMLRQLAEGDEEGKAIFSRVALYFDNDLAALGKQIARMLEFRDQWFEMQHGEDVPVIQDFAQILSRARGALEQVFRSRCAVDFTEVTRAAIRALGTPEQPSDLLYWLDYRIEHLLVDEFQDTSRAQYDLIEALTGQWSDGDGRTLFVVGDPMQSIYRFRGAELSLFLRSWMARRLGAVRLNPLRLTSNFRTTPEILQWVEAKFSAVMAEDNTLNGAIQFRQSVAARSKSGGAPNLIPLVDDTAGTEEAREVVRILKSAKDRARTAILVRSRSHLAEILPALREEGIEYEAIEIDLLKEQQHVLDVLALTRAILHVADRVSWLACLRAPWCGLTLEDLTALAEAYPDRTVFALLSDAEQIGKLSPDGRHRAVRVQEILASATEQAGRVALRPLIEKTWMALGGPAILAAPNQHEDIDTVLGLLEELDEGGTIRDFSLVNQRLETLFARPRSGGDRVQVMTIYQAKGLEFDTVIIPKLGSATRTAERDLLSWTEQLDEGGRISLLIAAQPRRGEEDPDYQRICDAIDAKEQEELKRVFYVACTRARNELFLLGNVKSKKNDPECCTPGGKTFLRLIWESVKVDFDAVLRRRARGQENGDQREAELARTTLRRLAATWKAPEFELGVEWRPQVRKATASARKVTYEWVSDTSRHVGTVVHELLKRVARDGAATWSAGRMSRLAAVVESDLLRLGVTRGEVQKATTQVVRAVASTLSSERGRWILADHAEAQSEWAIGGLIQDRLISGTIDRMFRDKDGRLWVIDFKTSEHQGARLESFLDEEQRRYRAQLESYGTLLATMAKGPIWLGLYFPLLDGWREWEFEEEAALVSV